MTDQSLADGVSVPTSDYRKITLKNSSANGTKVNAEIQNGGAVFTDTVPTTNVDGCYAIHTFRYSSSEYRKLLHHTSKCLKDSS